MAQKKRKRKTSAANYVGFRATPEQLSFLDARCQPGEARGSVTRKCLERYIALLVHGQEELQSLELTEEEVLQVMKALNGVLFTPETVHLVWANIADQMGDEHPLTKKIRSLSPAGCFALVDVAERFWRGTHEVLREIIREEPR